MEPPASHADRFGRGDEADQSRPARARRRRRGRAALLPSEARSANNGGAAGHAGGGRMFGSAPAVPSAQELAALADALYRAGFYGRRVVLAAPSGGLMTTV